MLSAHGEKGSMTGVIVCLGLRSEIVDIIESFRERLMCSIKYEVCCAVLISL